MNIPNNVAWFETFLYLSLTLDALSVAFGDRPSSGDFVFVPMILEAGLILLLVYFVHLAALDSHRTARVVGAVVVAASGRKRHRTLKRHRDRVLRAHGRRALLFLYRR